MIPPSRPTVEAAAARAAARAVRSGRIAQGKEVARFEAETARFLGRREGVAVSSGTAALHLALLALGVRPGDDVLIPSYTCAALLQAARMAGARPVLFDIDPRDFSFSTQEIRRKKGRRARALILTHTFGFPLDVAAYRTLGIPIVEDAAQGLGARLDSRPAGGMGSEVAVLSFYATKMITTGEGGMLLADRARIAGFARDRRGYDEKRGAVAAFNYKLTDVAAAIGRAQLRRLPEFLRRRRAIAQQYRRALAEGTAPEPAPGAEPSHHRFVFRAARAQQALAHFARRGVCARRPVFQPLHRALGLRGFPGADELQRTLISVPIYPSLKNGEISKITEALRTL